MGKTVEGGYLRSPVGFTEEVLQVEGLRMRTGAPGVVARQSPPCPLETLEAWSPH